MNTRALAAQILIRVQDEGAYSNVVLPLATADLDPRDRAFVYNLVTGALRRQRHTATIIEAACSRQLSELDPEVRAVLQVAAAELITDTKSVVYATVNEAVEAIKQLDRPKAASFVNAVLRRLVGEVNSASEMSQAVEWSVPDWLALRLQLDHGAEEAARLLVGLRREGPQVAIRVRPGGKPPEGAIAAEGIADAYYLSAPHQTPHAVIADAASTAVGHAVAAQPGQRVLDMAAAPGGKTIHLWDQLEAHGHLVAMDFHRRRLRSARRRLTAIGVRPSWVRADGRRSPFQDASFDTVLLDAPCTGLGTLRRRPEIAMRLESGSPERLAVRQQALVDEALRLTRPGGRIVYSVCTLFAAETVDIVSDLSAHAPEGLPGREWGNGLLLTPHGTGTDGMFISVIDR